MRYVKKERRKKEKKYSCLSIYLSIYLSISTYIYINTACVVKVQLMLYGVKLGKNL